MANVLVEWQYPWGALGGITPFAGDVTRTWLLNDIGTASFSLAATTPDLEKIIQWNNIIRIYEDGLETWTGVITRREWNRGSVTVSLKSAEYLLAKHITGKGFIAQDTAGFVGAEVLSRAVFINDGRSLLQPGLMDARPQHFIEGDYLDCYDVFKRLTEDRKAFFWVDEGLRVNLTNERGQIKTDRVILREGIHFSEPIITEDAEEVLTHAVLIGKVDPTAGGNIEPSKAMKVDDTENHFHRAEVLDSEETRPENLIIPLWDVLTKRGRPRVTVDTAIINIDNVWSQFVVGDTIRLVLYSRPTPADLTALVAGLELSPDGLMRCVFEITDDSLNRSPEEWAPQ